MRKFLVVLLCAGVALVWSFCCDLSDTAQGGDGGPVPPSCVDLNLDGETDVSDAIHLLNWLFRGGPAPQACAQPLDLEARVSVLEGKLDDSWEFGRRLAGSYFATIRFDIPINLLLTFDADGTFTWSNQGDFGWPKVEGRHHFQSPGHGTWRRSGDRAITLCAVFFTFHEDGSLDAVDRVRGVYRFDENFERFTASWTMAWFDPTVNPWDSVAAPRGEINGNTSGTRIPCE